MESQDLSNKVITQVVAKKFKVDTEQVVVYGRKTKFGGGKSTGFCLIYDSLDSRKKYEPKHRLVKSELMAPSTKKNRKTKKDEKNRTKHLRGKYKLTGGKKKKKKD